MYNVQKIKDDVYYVGVSDRKLVIFEAVYPIPEGVSYNSYLISDDKTVLLDTVDKSCSEQFIENVRYALGGRALDYLIVNHMEPDHCATIERIVSLYPNVKIVSNRKVLGMIKQFFDFDIDSVFYEVAEGSTLSTGKHKFTFVSAPMVHWPEVMVTYDISDKILYSADAFGTFGALSGNIYADELNFRNKLIDESRRYYTNIVGKYGVQVKNLLKKASEIEISMICPLHGPIWRKDIEWIVDTYYKWATYTPEDNEVLIAYSTVYGHTGNAAEILSTMLAERGVKSRMYDVSMTHPSIIVSEAFRCSHIVLATTTYNSGIFATMNTVVHDIAEHYIQDRHVAIIENGTWAATASDLIKENFKKLKNITYIKKEISIKSSLKENQINDLSELADAIVASMPKPEVIVHDEKSIEPNAMFKISYGLYVLTAKDGNKDNGCIINTVTQITDSPKRISIAVNRANLTHDMIKKTGVFNVSVLTTDTPFQVFRHFGFNSGRDTDKFADGENKSRSKNGLLYIERYSNSYISCKVTHTIEYNTHTVFIADVTEAKELSKVPSVTYEYYFENIKPKPKHNDEKKKGYVCKICGYVYEGEELPRDFICPLCKHGAEDFEKL